MERLTERNPLWIDDELWERACEPDCEEIDAVYRKLKDYEDAEEQGFLLRLPCKVGDTVHVLTQNAIKKEVVRDVQYRGQTYATGQRWFLNIGALLYCENDIGKTVFLTRDEAETKLKEMEENHGE